MGIEIEIDRNIIEDGDVSRITLTTRDDGDKFVTLDLGHRAGNWNIILKEKELDALIAKIKET